MIGLGYPADRPLRPIVKPERRPFDEVVHRGGCRRADPTGASRDCRTMTRAIVRTVRGRGGAGYE